MAPAKLTQFRSMIWAHYHARGRKLPWRKTRDPYKILVSEVMLQQTQVLRVLEKYPEFIRAFPDIQTLARAPLRHVLQVWQGMGYNRRALALKRLAEEVMRRHGGKLPHDEAALREFPGVGPATAGAVMAYAFNKPAVFIETNIRRVFIHHFFPQRPHTKHGEGVNKKVSDKEIFELVAATVSKTNPREWYWALMDYGTYLAATVPNPNRRSKHYTKQARFEGSQRQLRGQLLKFFAERHMVKMSDLHRAFPKKSHLASVLRELIAEGFLRETSSHYELA